MNSTKTIDEFGNIRYKNENDLFHREDGPAYETISGTKEWYINGRLHREDGPAYERPDGYKEWWIGGRLHREDGPAVEFTDDYTWYYLNNDIYNKPDWELEVAKLKLERIKDL